MGCCASKKKKKASGVDEVQCDSSGAPFEYPATPVKPYDEENAREQAYGGKIDHVDK